LAARSALSLPAPVLALAARPAVVDGQHLDPQVAAGLAFTNRFGPRIDRMEVDRARRAVNATFDVFNAAPLAMARVHDVVASGPRLRRRRQLRRLPRRLGRAPRPRRAAASPPPRGPGLPAARSHLQLALVRSLRRRLRPHPRGRALVPPPLRARSRHLARGLA